MLTSVAVMEPTATFVCIRTGKWPRRSGDVEELEKVLIEQHEAEEAKEAAK